MSWRRLGQLFLLVSGALVLLGALPGDMNGCATDLSDEVNYVEYCQERCTAICDVAIEANTYLYIGDVPEGVEIEDLCQEDCEHNLSCFLGQLCTAYDDPDDPDDDPYVSTEEADACLDQWRSLDPDHFAANAPNCGRDTDGDGRADFIECPIINTCDPEVLCDPPEWQ